MGDRASVIISVRNTSSGVSSGGGNASTDTPDVNSNSSRVGNAHQLLLRIDFKTICCTALSCAVYLFSYRQVF